MQTLAERKAAASRNLKLVAIGSVASFLLVALFGEDIPRHAKTSLSTQKLAITDSAAFKFFGEDAGAGFNGHSHFEPDSDADFGIAESNMGGGALTGYASDLETRMRIHKGEVGDADTKEALKNLDLANKKLDMPGIISFP